MSFQERLTTNNETVLTAMLPVYSRLKIHITLNVEKHKYDEWGYFGIENDPCKRQRVSAFRYPRVSDHTRAQALPNPR